MAFRDRQLLDMVPPRLGSVLGGRRASIHEKGRLDYGPKSTAYAGGAPRISGAPGDARLQPRPARDPWGSRARESLPDGARYEECTYTNTAGSRKYKLFVPGCYCGKPLPLIMMLHGCKQSPDDFATGTRMNELAEEQGFLVAYLGNHPRQTR